MFQHLTSKRKSKKSKSKSKETHSKVSENTPHNCTFFDNSKVYMQQVSLNLPKQNDATFSKAAATFSKVAAIFSKTAAVFSKTVPNQQNGPRGVFSGLQPFPKLNFICVAFLHVLHGSGQEEVD